MGTCGSNLSPEERAEARRCKELDQGLEKNLEEDLSRIKLLLLGAGESGKSTVFKQMKILYKKGYTEEELMEYTQTIHSNIFSSLVSLIANGRELGSPETPEFTELCDEILNTPEDTIITPDFGSKITALWNDTGIQETYGKRNLFQLNDSTKIFLEDIERLTAEDFTPTEKDVLNSRVRTSGVVEDIYMVDATEFRMFDVGGQRNERRKWIHCFDGVTAIIFVAAISEYDQVLYEDHTQNRMHEALNLFDEICNSRWFRKTNMILFLNKKDLFEEKIQRVDIKLEPCEDCPEGRFLDYDGGCDYENGKRYFETLFRKQNRADDKDVYVHTTCATDTKNVAHVFNACKDIIMKGSLGSSGFV